MDHPMNGGEPRAGERKVPAQPGEREFRLLVEAVVDYAIYMLDENGYVSSWNMGAQRIKGYTAAEVLGEHFSRFFTEEDRREGRPYRSLKIAREHGRYESEGYRLRKDGTKFWAFAVIDAIYDESGKVVGFAKITRDMTERRNAELELARSREQLAQAQKMEALGQLTGGIAHDFNNLLMVVQGQATRLRKRISDPASARMLDTMLAAADRGRSLTAQLLTFSRRQKMNPTVVDLGERIAEMRMLLAGSLRADIEIVIDMPDDLWPVLVDVGELQLALLNIAINSRDAMPQGGVFKVSARNVPAAETASHGCEDDCVALSCADTGTGIPPDVIGKVFEPFFTTKDVGKGTGLGLSQVHGFAHQSGGGVTLDSEPGKGTTVTLYLPRGRSPVTAVATPTPAPASHGAGNILLVEDDAGVADVVHAMLHELGYDVVHVEHAAEALDVLRTNSSIDLVLSDVVMPGEMNGLQLAAEIRRTFPDVPVLLTSGYTEAVKSANTVPILRKPYDLPQLSSALSQCIAGAAAG